MYRKSIKETEFEDESPDIGLCSNGVNNAQETCPSTGEFLPRNNRQSKVHCSQCERIASKKGLCEKHYRQYWRSLNKEHNKQYASQYHQTIRKPILQSQHKPTKKQCLQCNVDFLKVGTNQDFCSFKCRDRAAYLKNKDKIVKEKALYYEKNKFKINEQKKLYKREQRKNPLHRLKDNLRSRLSKAIKNNYKSGSAIKDLGCTVQEFRAYLESRFTEGMTWGNYGKWHIDHIIPLNSFDLSDSEQLKKACHYTNLQPLWAEANIAKSDTV